jgi:hypothetical protein
MSPPMNELALESVLEHSFSFYSSASSTFVSLYAYLKQYQLFDFKPSDLSVILGIFSCSLSVQAITLSRYILIQ